MSGRRNKSPPELELKLNLTVASDENSEATEEESVMSSEIMMSPKSSCVSYQETTSSPETSYSSSMLLVGCPRCLMYVMLSDVDPKCPKCKSTVLLDVLNEDHKTKN